MIGLFRYDLQGLRELDSRLVFIIIAGDRMRLAACKTRFIRADVECDRFASTCTLQFSESMTHRHFLMAISVTANRVAAPV